MSALIKNHRLYSAFKQVKGRLHAHQFVCWIAGGAVRDFCLGKKVEEFDLVTDATTEVLKELFPEAILVGESFGVLKIPLDDGDYFDLTSFREEADYQDGRRPSHVSTSTPTKDSVRRDFTINALFWNDVTEAMVDYQGGRQDLSFKVLRAVGDADIRFGEDYLRIMRLLRFSALLKFTIEDQTYKAALRHITGISKISGERIWSELKKTDAALAWAEVMRTDLGIAIFREIFKQFNLDLNKVKEAKAGLSLYVVLNLLSEEQDLSDVLKSRLKLSNQELKEYQKTRYLLQNFEKKDLEEIAFEIEKDEVLSAQLNLLAKSGWFDFERVSDVEKMLKLQPNPLLLAKEMMGIVPAHQLGVELKKIRVLQLKGELKTGDEALVYLKKKYAEIK